jgi:uncharacterized protein YcbK (DUF882 family)
VIDRRRLLEVGFGAGVSLAAPALAVAAAHQRIHHHQHHRHPAHRIDPAKAPVQPVRYEDLHMAPLRIEQVRLEPRAITLKNLHTDESLEAVYWEGGQYVPDALEAVNKVLRDFRTGEVHEISPGLLDVLVDLRAATGSSLPFQVISGYRSAQTNAMLREKSAEVAQHSLHMDGMAIDLYLDDVDLDRLHMAALDLSRGGVGYYPVTKFVHVDVGPVRHWQGA